MPIKSYKPYTPSRRGMTSADFSELTATTPEKSLVTKIKRTGGRNNTGMIMVRHQGGGHKRAYRAVDFKRDKFGVPGRVATIEYDPNRSARIALLHYADGAKAYIIAPSQLKVGATVESGPEADIKIAVETLFKVQVEKVRTMIMHGKFRRFGQGGGVLPDWKKAIVTVAKGQKIDFATKAAS